MKSLLFGIAVAWLATGCATDHEPRAVGGLENFGIVDNHLLRGAQPNLVAIDALKQMDVKTVINLRMTNDVWQAEETEVRSRGMTYTNIPMGGLARPTVETIGTVLSIITNSPGKVFVHCQYGKDRTGTIVACYRMAHDGWTSEAAQREADRFNMSPLEFQMKDFIVEFGKSHPPTQK